MDTRNTKMFEAELLGDSADWAKLATGVVSEVATRAVTEVQTSEAKKKATADDVSSAAKAQAADATALNACTDLAVAKKKTPNDTGAIAAKESYATLMQQAADAAGAGLTAPAQKFRLEAANTLAKNAAEAWSRDSSSIEAQARATCAAQLVKKLSTTTAPAVVDLVKKENKTGAGFFARMSTPVKIIGGIGILGVVGGGIFLAVRHFRVSRRVVRLG